MLNETIDIGIGGVNILWDPYQVVDFTSTIHPVEYGFGSRMPKPIESWKSAYTTLDDWVKYYRANLRITVGWGKYASPG